MTLSNIDKAKELERTIREREQTPIATEHVFHAGLYARTVRVPAGTVFTSVLIKRATVVIVNGTCDILVGQSAVRYSGYNVFQAEAPRKSAYIARTGVEMTMLFATSATTVAEAEAEFTDEAESLLSHRQGGDIVMTEEACLESLPQPRS